MPWETETLTREQRYQLVWERPVQHVAESIGVGRRVQRLAPHDPPLDLVDPARAAKCHEFHDFLRVRSRFAASRRGRGF